MALVNVNPCFVCGSAPEFRIQEVDFASWGASYDAFGYCPFCGLSVLAPDVYGSYDEAFNVIVELWNNRET